jgi:hypothetical protein
LSNALDANPNRGSTGSCNVGALPSSLFVSDLYSVLFVEIFFLTDESLLEFGGVFVAFSFASLMLSSRKITPYSLCNALDTSFSKMMVFCKAFSRIVALFESGSFVGPANNANKWLRVCTSFCFYSYFCKRYL